MSSCYMNTRVGLPAPEQPMQTLKYPQVDVIDDIAEHGKWGDPKLLHVTLLFSSVRCSSKGPCIFMIHRFFKHIWRKNYRTLNFIVELMFHRELEILISLIKKLQLKKIVQKITRFNVSENLYQFY